ncbi:unnamed protein product [Hymenolepis diminuta]|uniref:Calcium-dependent secretion activator n=1 Tax=Hymenolepis diminuta TaxID=6216 RepID=A0A0R3SXA6_HYMDI|nr:unnamed protein product [Hymenolepis diminuta]
MSKQYTTDLEGDGGAGLSEEVFSSSVTSLNTAYSPAPAGDRHSRGPQGNTKQPLNNASSAVSISSSIRERPSVAGGSGGEEASPSPSTSSNAARHPQRVSVAGRGTPRSSASAAAGVATQETAEVSEKEKEEMDRETRLEIYLFVVRCISYPFYAKLPTDPVKRYLKVTKSHLTALKGRFQSFLNGELDIVGDEAFTNAVQSYYDIFLCSDRISTMVKGGGCSMHDFREVFRINIECRIQCLPDIEGLDKNNISSAWMVKFDQICRGGAGPSAAVQRLQVPQPEVIMSKEQLYDMFQNVLGVKKYEHQILFNALQVS